MQWYESAYQNGSFHGLPQSQAAVLYAVLAHGTLGDTQQDNPDFGSASRVLLYTDSDTPSENHVIAGFLLAMYYWGTGRMSNAWITLGFAVRAGQGLGMHTDCNTLGEGESDNRAFLWWSIYIADRYRATSYMAPTLADSF